jgi:8-oxo-dGTP diphosphatase
MAEIRFATKGIIFKADKVLVLVRVKGDGFRPGEEDFPGGKIEFGEEPSEGLKREIMEESNLDVEVMHPLSCWSHLKEDKAWQLVGVTFYCKYKSGEVKLSSEHESFIWNTPENILKSNYPKWMKDDVKAALELMRKK